MHRCLAEALRLALKHGSVIELVLDGGSGSSLSCRKRRQQQLEATAAAARERQQPNGKSTAILAFG